MYLKKILETPQIKKNLLAMTNVFKFSATIALSLRGNMICADMVLESLKITGVPATESVFLGKRLRHYTQYSTHLYF